MQFFGKHHALGSQLATIHAQHLRGLLGLAGAPEVLSDHPALAWRRAGLMAVTGRPGGTGLVAPVALSAAANGALAALKFIAPSTKLPENGAILLGERARLLGLSRGGSVSANGSCRLIETSDGRIALNLPRAEDWELIPALLGQPASDWGALARIAAGLGRGELLAQGRLLGLAIAPDTAMAAPECFAIERLGPGRDHSGAPLVVDLSSLWAGPLAGALLADAGARVVKVESTTRADGARRGNQPFFDLLNAGKSSLLLDFTQPDDLRHLRDLVRKADIVIEGSRPRALASLGIDAKAEAARGATWLSITGHGRTGDAANWIGFGDDAAIAGGLAAAMREGWGEPMFAGDAIADPLTGITAAFAGWASWLTGGGHLVSLSLSGITANAIGLYKADQAELRDWQKLAEADEQPLYPLRQPGK